MDYCFISFTKFLFIITTFIINTNISKKDRTIQYCRFSMLFPIIIMRLYLPILLFLLQRIIKTQRPIVLTSTPIQINLEACQMEFTNQWTRINIGIEGGARPYQFYYDQYPEGWKYLQSSVFIPRSTLTFTRKFPLRIRVIDQYGNQARASIVFLISQGNIAVSPFIYPYEKTFDDNFFNDGGFRERPKLVRSQQFYSQFQNNYLVISPEQLARYRQRIAQEQYTNYLGSGFYTSYPSITQRGVYTMENIYDPFRQRIDQVPMNNVFQRQSPTRLINSFDQMNMINPQRQITNNIVSKGIRIPTQQMNNFDNNFGNQQMNNLGLLNMQASPQQMNNFVPISIPSNSIPLSTSTSNIRNIQPSPLLQPNNLYGRETNPRMTPITIQNAYPQQLGNTIPFNQISSRQGMVNPNFNNQNIYQTGINFQNPQTYPRNNIQITSLTSTPRNTNTIRNDRTLPVNILTPNPNFNGLNNPMVNVQGWSIQPSQEVDQNEVPLMYNLVKPGVNSYALVASDKVDQNGTPISYRLQPVQPMIQRIDSILPQQQFNPQQFFQTVGQQSRQPFPGTTQNFIYNNVNQQRPIDNFNFPNWFLVQEKDGKSGLPPGIYLIASNNTNNPLSFLPFIPIILPQPQQQQQQQQPQPIVINIDGNQGRGNISIPARGNVTANASFIRTGVQNISAIANATQNTTRPIPPQPRDNPNINPTRNITQSNITNTTRNTTNTTTTTTTTTTTLNITNTTNTTTTPNITTNITNVTNNRTNLSRNASISPPPRQTPIVVPKLSTNYSGLPTNLQIDDLIRKQDQMGLRQVINKLYEFNNLTCQQKSAYTLNLLGRLQIAIKDSTYFVMQIENSLVQAKKSYDNFLFEIQQRKFQQTTLNTQQQKQKIQVEWKRLDALRSQLNGQQTIIPPLSSFIDSLRQNIAMEESNSQIARKQVTRQKTLLNEADSIAQSLINNLKIANAEKASITNTINKIVSIINQSQTKIKNNLENITKLQRQILELQFTVDTEKFNYRNLEAQVQKYREQIARASRRQAQIMPEIINLQEKLRLQRNKLAAQQLDKLKQMVKELQRSLPNLQKFVDQNYYKCNNASNLTANQNGSSIVYIVGVPEFQKYIQSSYLIQPDWSRVSLPTQQVILNHVNILDPLWQGAFGNPYDSVSFINTKDFSFKDDFNCLNPSSLQSGLSEIVSIGNRFIMVNHPEGMIKLNLATCTRLQSTLYLPSIGQKVYWRGSPGKVETQFNIYRATCI